MQQEILQDSYVYQVNFSGLAASGTATDDLQIDATSDFQLEKLTYFADIAAAAQTQSSRVIPLVTVDLLITGSGRPLMNSPVPIPDIFGTGEIPFILPSPKILPKRSVMTITLANFDAASTYNIRLSFIGSRIYRRSAPQLQVQPEYYIGGK